ncbi:proliferation marker protein Ki-67 isoform X2 [Labrus mixtus]|uniref:proliferation marker protein Ki-67 isoform X2 n=1 Tax=Labrus mixtus TaxID=508554 RepID=UPI0029C02E73|nr:proliferation marker protein Ki-67 isoform X2 [Labrus mixtus]
MPLHGKIVVIKRSGGDGTEFPLTATCLFGRKPDCDIRIQLPQVSKEHCRIDLNENKEIILTNLSSVNPTRVNGEALQQSERLKHGDVITIIDRSFRFEYPPAPTPKKRSSVGGKTETLKVLQDQQVGDSVPSEIGEKRISQVSTDPHLKDGTNHDNIQRSLEKTVEMETKEEGSQLQSKTASPFNDLYQMIKKSLDVKTPRKSSASLLQTPTSRFCTPKPTPARKSGGKPALSTEDKITPKKDEAEVEMETEKRSIETPKSVKKQRRSSQTATETPGAEPVNSANSETPSPQKRIRTPPQRFTAGEVVEQICAGSPKSPTRRKSKEATPVKPAGIKEEAKQEATSPKAEEKRRASPRNSGKVEKDKEASKKRKSGELGSDLPKSQMKKKRVSFGGQLSPELFDKRLPPDSPLRKGAAPRRSLSLLKPKLSLLRRASVIGLLKEQESPGKKKTPSPKRASSAKSASPKTPTPTKKSPKSKSPSPKAATPATKSPKSKSPSTNKMETPKSTRLTPAVQGRFSVSRISTPSPVAEEAVTPKLPGGRKSIVRMTPKVTKSAVKVMVRRSGISRASMKAKNSWADMVKFGQPKTQVAAPVTKAVIRKTKKKAAVPKPQTPARAIPGHFSTGHACSPVTIVVSRAQKQKLVQPTGAAPRLVTNIALLKKNMKMDEDLTGVSEMFKTPANERKTRSVIDESSTMKTPMAGLETPLVEPSVLNTPEETGEMMVSPLSVSVKDREYNSEAVQRLLVGDQDSSFVSDVPASETSSEDPVEQQCTDVKTASVSTSKQKPELPDCLTGVKRVMKTPKQKAEPVEDLRGRLLKTPKQKLEQQECLTGVKRIMRTPKQKAKPIEDLRGKILKTPKQKPEQQECLSGVKRIMQTPQQEVAPLEDIKIQLLETPKQQPEQLECMTEVKDIMQTPKQEVEPLEDVKGKLLETPKAPEARDAGMETPVHMQESEAVSEVSEMKTPNTKSSPLVCLTGIKRIMKTPKEKSVSVEDNFGIQTLMKTPRLKGNTQVEDFEGLQEHMEEPTSQPTGQQETEEIEAQKDSDCDAEDAKELDFALEEPQDNVPSVTDDVPQVDLEEEVDVKEAFTEDHFEEVPRDDHEKTSEAMETVCQEAADEIKPEEQDAVDENLSDEQPQLETATGNVMETETSETDPKPQTPVTAMLPEVEEAAVTVTEIEPTTSDPEAQTPVTEMLPEVEEAAVTVTEIEPTTSDPEAQTPVTEMLPEVEEATSNVTEMETTASDPDLGKKPVRGRKAKTVETKAAEENQETAEQPEELAVPASVRGRRGNKTEATAAPAVRQTTRGRNTKITESKGVEPAAEISESLPSEVAVKPKRGRNAKKAPEDKAVTESSTTTMPEPESQLSLPAEVDQEANVTEVPVEEAVMKPKCGRRAKQPEEAAPQQKDVEVPTADVANADTNEVCSEMPEVVPSKSVENESTILIEAAPAAPVSESLPVVEAETDAATVQKKPVRGRRAKTVESKVEEKQEAETEHHEEPAVPAPVRGRRGKKTETAALAAVRQKTRGRNTKSQENTSDEQPEVMPENTVESTQISKQSSEVLTEQTSQINTHEEDKDSEPPAEEAAVKPVRGRKTRQTPVEQQGPKKHEVSNDEEPTAEAEPQKSIPSVVKPKRGRKTKADTVEQNEEAEESVVTVETKQPAQPAARAKRGRNTKKEEEKQESTETSESTEPAKKVRRTRKAEQHHEEVETVVPDEAPLVEEEVTMEEQESVATKPKRGGRKTTQDTKSESTEVPAVSTTDKPKRGRRGKQVTEEAVVAAVAEEEPEAEEEVDAEPEAQADKPSRGRQTKTSVKKEVSKAIPPKRARRGAAAPLEETNTMTSSLTESAAISVEPAKRGRRGAAKPTDDSKVTVEQAPPEEESSSAVVEEPKGSKRSVKWKPDLEVIEITKVTPIKAVRGRKPKLADQVEAGKKNMSKDANSAEEKDLSDAAVEAQPAKRARRGAKVVNVTSDEAESTSKEESVEAETQTKTRRGRSAKK